MKYRKIKQRRSKSGRSSSRAKQRNNGGILGSLKDLPLIGGIFCVLTASTSNESRKRSIQSRTGTSLDLSKYDKACIRRQIKKMDEELKGERKKAENQVGRVQWNDHQIDELPRRPEIYNRIGEREDYCGRLEYFNTTSDPDMAIPDFGYLSKNVIKEGDEKMKELRARIGPVPEMPCCKCPDGCKIGSCICIDRSIYDSIHNRIDEGKPGNLGIILECGPSCACQRYECPSIVHLDQSFTCSVIQQKDMEYGTMATTSAERGQLLMEFTGRLQASVDEDVGEQKWAYTLASWKHNKNWKWLTQMKSGESLFINPLQEGNASRHICHSYFPNVEWYCIYKAGESTADARAIIAALGPLAINEFMYLNYSSGYQGIKRKTCCCTRPLCHDKVKIQWWVRLSEAQKFKACCEFELVKRKQMVEDEAAAEVEKKKRRFLPSLF